MKAIENRIENKIMYSNLVYPNFLDETKYKLLGKLDQAYFKFKLKQLFNADDIANKYAIQVDENIIWYRHDNSVFIIQQL